MPAPERSTFIFYEAGSCWWVDWWDSKESSCKELQEESSTLTILLSLLTNGVVCLFIPVWRCYWLNVGSPGFTTPQMVMWKEKNHNTIATYINFSHTWHLVLFVLLVRVELYLIGMTVSTTGWFHNKDETIGGVLTARWTHFVDTCAQSVRYLYTSNALLSIISSLSKWNFTFFKNLNCWNWAVELDLILIFCEYIKHPKANLYHI